MESHLSSSDSSTGKTNHEGSGIESLFESMIAEMAQLVRPSSTPPSPNAGARQQGRSINERQSPPGLDDRYRVLVEQIPAVVFMAMLDGGVSEAYVSPQVEEMLGFSREEWLDDPIRWYHQIHPGDRARWSMEAAEMVLKGAPLKSVYRVIARCGSVIWFHCEAKLVRHQDGSPWFIHGVGFDITELKQTEEALHHEMAERERLQQLELERQIARAEGVEQQLAAIVESSEDAIIGNALDGTITSWNAAAERLLGYAREEILGKSVLLTVPPELHDTVREILSDLAAGKKVAHKQTQRIAKYAQRIDVSVTVSPIRAGNRVVGASSIVRDITEQKRTEEALRESEERFRTMAETAADAIFRVDQDSKILFVNPAGARIFGYEIEELVGQGLNLLMPAHLREVHRTAVERYVRTGSRHLDWECVEVTGLHKSGRLIAIELSLGESTKDGRKLFTGFARDITERKRMEERLRLTEKLAATGRMAATIAHEINNPLAAVTNCIYLAKQDPASPQISQLLTMAEEELERVTHLTKQTLSFYHETEQGGSAKIGPLLTSVLSVFASRLKNRGIELQKEIENDPEIGVAAGEIRQILANLISNSIDAANSGGKIRVRLTCAGKDSVRLTIADTGSGIPKEICNKLFEPFFTTKKDVGTGLGLWVVKNIVEKYNGKILVRSSTTPGRSWTAISIFLPARIQAQEEEVLPKGLHGYEYAANQQ